MSLYRRILDDDPLYKRIAGLETFPSILTKRFRLTSADTPAQYGDVSALPVLDRMLESGDDAVPQAAQQAIQHITRQPGGREDE